MHIMVTKDEKSGKESQVLAERTDDKRGRGDPTVGTGGGLQI